MYIQVLPINQHAIIFNLLIMSVQSILCYLAMTRFHKINTAYNNLTFASNFHIDNFDH